MRVDATEPRASTPVRSIGIVLVLLPLLAACQSPPHVPDADVLSMELPSADGSSVGLGSISGNAASAFVFVAPDCPLSQNHTLTLNRLADQFHDDPVRFFGVVAGEWYDDAEVSAFIEVYRLAFPVLLDRDFLLADRFGARVTPEAFVVGPNGEVVYRGAIDNWVTTLGSHRAVTTENHLMDALTNLVEGRRVVVPEVQAVGCFIEREG